MPFNKEITGFENEREFQTVLQGCKVSELNPMFHAFLLALYGKLNLSDIVQARINIWKEKSDLMITINRVEKKISIKKGIKNSVHVESLDSFLTYLRRQGVPEEILKKLILYHYGDGTMDGTGQNRLSSEEYREKYPTEIKALNAYFNDEELIRGLITRFVLKGKNSNSMIDAILYGVVDDFVWITREEIVNVILSNRNIEASGLHFGSLFYQPMTRCLNYNKKYEGYRHRIQIKWYHLSDDIIKVMNERVQLVEPSMSGANSFCSGNLPS